MVNQYNKSYGSRSVNFVNNVNSKFWLQPQSELMAAMNTGLNLVQTAQKTTGTALVTGNHSEVPHSNLTAGC